MALPFYINHLGYLPLDDALRHSAFALQDDEWHEVLVIRDELKLDSHPGWHFFLKAVSKVTAGEVESRDLVHFSVWFLFILLFLSILLQVKHPVSVGLVVMIVLLLKPEWTHRLLIGRPLLISMAFLFFWAGAYLNKKFETQRNKYSVVFVLFLALSSFAHCQWYLYLLPLSCFLFVGKFRDFKYFLFLIIIGIGIGSLLTLKPVLFFEQTTTHLITSIFNPVSQDVLVPEFQKRPPDIKLALLFLVFVFIFLRVSKSFKSLWKNPFLILVLITWVLGQWVSRFWLDWGVPSLLIVLIVQTDQWISLYLDNNKKGFLSYISISLIFLASFVCVVGSDKNRRWSKTGSHPFLSHDNPIPSQWLPGENGIFYNDMTSGFMFSFYKYPTGRWKYVLGFEAAMMTPEDREIFYKIRQSPHPNHYQLWVNQMKQEDRLLLMDYVLPGSKTIAPALPLANIEWYEAPGFTWVGRLKRNS